MSKIDDLFDKKKDEAPMLDLSKTVINTAEEYRAVLDKVPDFKTRPEKVRAEDIKIKDRVEDQKTKTPRKEIRAYERLGTRGYEERQFTFMDPVPMEMRGLKFEELCAVPIEWRMLTAIRPKSKLDEEYFNRLIELGKSELKTKAKDMREFSKNPMIRKTKNRSGVTETRVVSCAECGEEYCDGKMCAITNYDMFARTKVEAERGAARAQPPAPTKRRARLRRRTRRKPRSKSAAPAALATARTKTGAKSDSEL
ncbi:hypothetical protein MSG28_005299 [Choristoneura fumiferana]|uniref:Uncharacterized protein n=2 Tax=Choristoneura fumiferana TaxID=7141 RepID=A0ACC0JR56_CHOFU|nr:hypothetical protein MSG28_005299 [Choristoneura fumiferana]KAI8426483.1 hypothetical protein MSG28_005299 [Choristoneura fumiferana]